MANFSHLKGGKTSNCREESQENARFVSGMVGIGMIVSPPTICGWREFVNVGGIAAMAWPNRPSARVRRRTDSIPRRCQREKEGGQCKKIRQIVIAPRNLFRQSQNCALPAYANRRPPARRDCRVGNGRSFWRYWRLLVSQDLQNDDPMECHPRHRRRV